MPCREIQLRLSGSDASVTAEAYGVVTSVHFAVASSSGTVTLTSGSGVNLLGNYAAGFDASAPGTTTLCLADLGGVVVAGDLIVTRSVTGAELVVTIGLSQT
jgi:hypothetical protein